MRKLGSVSFGVGSQRYDTRHVVALKGLSGTGSHGERVEQFKEALNVAGKLRRYEKPGSCVASEPCWHFRQADSDVELVGLCCWFASVADERYERAGSCVVSDLALVGFSFNVASRC